MMLSRSDRLFTGLAIIAALFTTLIYFSSGGNTPLAALPALTLMVGYCLPLVKKMSDMTVVACVLFLFLILDIPTNFPFYEFDPLTESLGNLLFEAAGKTIGVPALRLTGLEALTFGLVLWLGFRNRRREWYNLAFSPTFQFAVFLAMLIPLTGMLFTAIGVVKGNQISLAVTQIRFMPIIACWIYIGYIACRSYSDTVLIMRVFVGAMIIKALQGLFAYFFVFDMVMGKREYIMEHLQSDYMATAMFFLGAYLFAKHRRMPSWAVLSTGLLLFVPYMLNDRRASFMGVAFSLILSPVILKRFFRRRHVYLAGFGMLFLTFFIAGTWNVSGPAGILSDAIKSIAFKNEDPEAEPDYRDLENYNLYNAVMQNPITGLGFGKRFEIVADMPNIGGIYGSYDLIPHNNSLFMWAYGGAFGMAALGTFIALSLALMTRLFRLGHDWRVLAFAFVGFTQIIRWAIYVYADIGLLEARTTSVVGLMVGTAMSLLSHLESEPKEVHA